ncbi:hypothetical protein ACFPOE_08045 [Caenimonas terrae]|uniref:Lipoprotein n=1 Tax=Caenimonas terrae TaxID=696074 RepID=A0ABW0NB35_9BURK
MKTASPSEARGLSRRPARLAQACLCGLLAAIGAACAAEPADWVSQTASLTPAPLAAAGSPAPATGSTIEISASNLPRFDNFDGSSRTQQRLDMALLSPGRSAFGVTMGVTGLAPSRYGFNAGSTEGTAGVNLGLQYRYIIDNNRRVDITAWREMNRPNDALAMIQSRDAGYGARVEMQLSGAHSPLVAERGFVGMQLDGGARITVKRSMGRPMVYYRNQF